MDLIKKIKKAKKQEQLIILKYIEKNRAHINLAIQDERGNTALMWAVIRKQNILVDYLLAEKVPVNAQNLKGFTALVWAILGNSKELVLTLIEAGCEVNLPDKHKKMPILWAISQENPEIIGILLENGALPRACDDRRENCFDWAAERKLKTVCLQILNFEQKIFA